MYLPAQDMVYKRIFEQFVPGKSLPPLIDLIHNVSLVLVNTHPIFQYPRPIVPNMVQGTLFRTVLWTDYITNETILVGGLHIKSNTSETIAAEIFEYIQAAPEGNECFGIILKINNSIAFVL